MQDSLIRDVSDTAFMIAAYRAMEGERRDALFHDPLAEKLAGEHGRKIVAAVNGGVPRMRFMVWSVALRTHIIDDFIRSSIAHGTDAVLCLGAGLDTRPYRMALPESLSWIEVDFPHVIELKESRLAGERARCHLERVKLDLSDVPSRRKFLGDTAARFKRVLVLTEGVILYLTVEAAAQLAEDLRAHQTFAQWIVDYMSRHTMRYSQQPGFGMRNAPFLFDPEDTFAFFQAHGWTTKEVRYLWDEGQKLGRPLPLPGMLMGLLWLRSLFMSPARLDEARRFMGYVLLEPATGPS